MRVDLEVKFKWFPFHSGWMALLQLGASEGTLRLTGSYPIRGWGKPVRGGGAGREKSGERKGGSIYVLIYLFEEEEFVQ